MNIKNNILTKQKLLIQDKRKVTVTNHREITSLVNEHYEK